MKIAYVILAHKLPDQLVRLVHKLDGDSSLFLIHVDKKTTSDVFRRMQAPLQGKSNVRFLPRRDVRMSDFSMLQPLLAATDAILTARLDCDYVVHLSGQDYPIKSNGDIRSRLAASHGRSFMEHFALPDRRWQHENGGLDRVLYWHSHWGGNSYAIRRSGRLVRHVSAILGPRLSAALPIERKLPADLKPYGGSAFWCLSRACIDYAGNFVRQNRDVVQFFKYVQVPLEIFYQTVLLNSPLRNSIVDDDLHHVVWPEDPAVAHHPKTLGCADIDDLLVSDKLFARKFDSTFDSEVLDRLDAATG